MQDNGSKRNTKIFLLMSQFIGKTPSQCRSHHQKVTVFNKFYRKTIKKLELDNHDGSKQPESLADFQKTLQPPRTHKDSFEKNFESLFFIPEKIHMQEELIKKATFLNMIEEDHHSPEVQKAVNFTPYLSALKDSFEALENFSLNPQTDISHQNYITWKKVFGQIESVDGSINSLVNLMNTYSFNTL